MVLKEHILPTIERNERLVLIINDIISCNSVQVAFTCDCCVLDGITQLANRTRLTPITQSGCIRRSDVLDEEFR